MMHVWECYYVRMWIGTSINFKLLFSSAYFSSLCITNIPAWRSSFASLSEFNTVSRWAFHSNGPQDGGCTDNNISRRTHDRGPSVALQACRTPFMGWPIFCFIFRNFSNRRCWCVCLVDWQLGQWIRIFSWLVLTSSPTSALFSPWAFLISHSSCLGFLLAISG